MSCAAWAWVFLLIDMKPHIKPEILLTNQMVKKMRLKQIDNDLVVCEGNEKEEHPICEKMRLAHDFLDRERNREAQIIGRGIRNKGETAQSIWDVTNV